MRLAAIFAVVVLAGCEAARFDDPIRASGQTIALSGGDAGARRACFTCHGLDGLGGKMAPRLAGVDAGYLQRQLDDYASEIRPDPVMTPIAKALGADQRWRVAAFYAALAGPPVRDTAPDRLFHEGDAARGIRPCAQCHGARGEGAGPGNPPLAGHPAGYVAEQLWRWKAGKRRNDPMGVMLDVSRRLTDAEIAAVSAYAAGLAAPPSRTR